MRNGLLARSLLFGAACSALLATAAAAESFDIPRGDLASALDAYSAQSGIALIVSATAVKDIQTPGVKGNLTAPDALSRILKGTGFTANPSPSGVIEIVGASRKSSSIELPTLQIAQAAPAPRASVETVTVTSSKLGGADVQSIPIAITALSQEQLTATQTAGGPDLVKQVPNLTFTKTNFTGYNIQIRGIGTQAISVTTDPAVAVAFNDMPFIRNHFFEQEFYDLSQAEVLRGPQGTLYGRNATAGVVNIISAKPTDQFEAMASADVGNFKNHRGEGMINLPIVDDRFDLRIAGEWTKRNGYSFNQITDTPIDGRDLWSTRVTVALHPIPELRAYLVWEHFQEDDDRMRTAKQLCKTDHPPSVVDGVSVPGGNSSQNGILTFGQSYLSQGCSPTSLYSPDAFQVPYGFSIPYVLIAGGAGLGTNFVNSNLDPYASTVQSPNLRLIESTLDPHYKARNDTYELNIDYDVSPDLTLTSQTGGNQDFLWSTEDYNRFNTAPGLFLYQPSRLGYDKRTPTVIIPDGNYACAEGGFSYGGPQDCAFPSSSANQKTGVFCDPQLGCTNRLVAQDLSSEHAWQFSQELRLASKFSGPLNFSLGGNFMHYETEENYYVFINSLTLYAAQSGNWYTPYTSGVTDNSDCLAVGEGGAPGWAYPDPFNPTPQATCRYIDPNPISSLNNKGHNYFLSQNPYVLNSYAAFGEAHYNVTSDVKLTGGLRWTGDNKHFVDIPSEVETEGYGYPSIGVVNQSWREWTGRAAANWTPKFDFTDQTLLYASFAHGYKAGGANPPGAAFPDIFVSGGELSVPTHPLTFKPEFINAYELGTKNTLADGALTLNGDVFFYSYKGYQISEIVDRTSINLNFDATVKGAEIETSWEPLPGLKFNFAGGYENTNIDKNQYAIDLMDRTAGTPGWMVVRPFPTQASSCILPDTVVAAIITSAFNSASNENSTNATLSCAHAYVSQEDPVTQLAYTPCPTRQAQAFSTATVPFSNPGCAYVGFDPSQTEINNGEGFAKNVGGNELPNAPHFTVSTSADYTIPITPEWASTLHVDYYWQDYSWSRVFNDSPYDRIRGYTNVNLALILTNQNGWQVMGYLKNVFDTTAITGTFLNSDDSGLTTNVFLTDPRLFGVRVTKNW